MKTDSSMGRRFSPSIRHNFESNIKENHIWADLLKHPKYFNEVTVDWKKEFLFSKDIFLFY